MTLDKDIKIKREIKILILELFEYLLYRFKYSNKIRNISLDTSELDEYIVKYKIYYTNNNSKNGTLNLLFYQDNLSVDNILKEILIHES